MSSVQTCAASVTAARVPRQVPLDAKYAAALYLTLVFSCRLFLRSAHAKDLHWAVTMALEDGMSVLSFVLGIVYLHRNNGGPLGAFAKCLSGTPEDAFAAGVAMNAGYDDETDSEEEMDDEDSTDAPSPMTSVRSRRRSSNGSPGMAEDLANEQPPLRLFSFAL